MRLNSLKAILKTAVRGASVLLLGAGMASAQSVNLTAGSSTLILPDGNSVPMWGYACTAAVTATCANLSTGAWSPVLITVPASASGSTSLTITLTNSLRVPTSITIVGQLGGGLGNTATSDPSPDHSNAQGATTWPIAGGPGASAPSQGPRVRSFSSEVGPGATVTLPAWATLRPGTYLIESGTHPSIQGPMGLYGNPGGHHNLRRWHLRQAPLIQRQELVPPSPTTRKFPWCSAKSTPSRTARSTLP